MSMRSIVEFNHDYLDQLKKDGHISHELWLWIVNGANGREPFMNGLRYLRLRHHSEKLKLEIV